MKSKRWELFKFSVFVIISSIAGFAWTNLVQNAFWNSSRTFPWIRTTIVLVVVGAAGGCWMYIRRAGITGKRDRVKTAFTFHAPAYGIALAMLIAYTLVHPPTNTNWIFPYLGWGLVLCAHGLLARHIRDTPEDIFV